MNSTARFNVVPAGRRSGKTEIAKRRLVLRALSQTKREPLRYIASAPTHPQAKAIYWEDLKDLTPKSCIVGRPNETELSITLKNRAIIKVVGMDRPERIEGPPLAHWLGDEYANMKPEAWRANVRPALADNNGTADLIGVPEGRTHYFEMYCNALTDTSGEWKAFTWFSDTVLPASEIAAARNDLDELTFRQEFQAEFVSFSGIVYYTWADANIVDSFAYKKERAVAVNFDFNVEPGTCSIVQEADAGTFVIREVFLERNGYTINVAKAALKVLEEIRHEGDVYIYGDATGGARKTSQTEGSDWELVRKVMKPVLGERLKFRVARSNPEVKDRINAVNARVCNTNGLRRLFVLRCCKQMILDFQGVIGDSMGGIDKRANDSKRTHLTDGLGYYIHSKYPVKGRIVVQTQM